jgi:hypothetical protein
MTVNTGHDDFDNETQHATLATVDKAFAESEAADAAWDAHFHGTPYLKRTTAWYTTELKLWKAKERTRRRAERLERQLSGEEDE